jgi:hypothetical protein
MAASELSVQPQVAQAWEICGNQITIGMSRPDAARKARRLAEEMEYDVVRPHREVEMFMTSPGLEAKITGQRSRPADCEADHERGCSIRRYAGVRGENVGEADPTVRMSG